MLKSVTRAFLLLSGIILIVFMASCASSSTTPVETLHPLPPVSDMPDAPTLVVPRTVKTIPARELERIIREHASVNWLAEDSLYFLPTEYNMDVVINYLDDVYRNFDIRYIPEGLDCDDFARSKTALSRIILSHAYKAEAAPAVFTIFVRQEIEWASVPAGGGHALIVYACVDENNEVKVFVWEPQSRQIVSVLDYPNKDNVFYVGAERIEEIVTKEE